MSILAGGTHCWVLGVKLPCARDVREHFWHPWNATVTGIDRNFCYMKFFVSFMVGYCRFGEVIIMWPGICILCIFVESLWPLKDFGAGKHLLSGRVVQPDYDKRWEESELAISQPFDFPRFHFSRLHLPSNALPSALNNVSDTIKDLNKKRKDFTPGWWE